MAHVKDYGAIGNDFTNDTVAIQNALNSSDKFVELEANKKYRTSASLTIPSGVTIEGTIARQANTVVTESGTVKYNS